MSAPPRWPFAGLVALLFVAACYTTADLDLWGHLRFGLDIWQTHTLPSIDPYSFTQDKPWVNHEWLSEWLMAAAWSAGGSTGLVLLKGVVIFAVFAMIWRALGSVHRPVRVAVLVVVAAGTIHMTSSIRPQIWTFAALVTLLRVLASDWPRRWWLPLVFLAWANLHGGWILGVAVLVVWAGAAVWRAPRDAPQWVGFGLACLGATLINPYGWRLWRLLIETVRPGRPVVEWAPLWETPFFNWIPWFLAVAAMLWAATRPGFSQRVPAVAVLSLLAVGAARVLRIESLFVAATALLIAPALAFQWPARVVRVGRVTGAVQWIAAGLVLVIPGSGAVSLGSVALNCLPVVSNPAPDVDAVRWLASGVPGRLVTSFNWGEYAIWHLGPRLRVSFDGRRETVYSDTLEAENAAVLRGTGEGVAVLERWAPEYVWLPAESTRTRDWLVAHGYRLAFESRVSYVAVRTELPALTGPAPASRTSRRCFPDE